MQDVDSKENTVDTQSDLTLGWRELPVESLGHCQSVGNWIFFSRGRSRETTKQVADHETSGDWPPLR
jgi:hypothetical protein